MATKTKEELSGFVDSSTIILGDTKQSPTSRERNSDNVFQKNLKLD